jgi:hypothetical protein
MTVYQIIVGIAMTNLGEHVPLDVERDRTNQE